MERVIETATQLAATDQSVLIFGAAGSGKGLVARSIHYASDRTKEPFVELDCSALPEEVVAVELFGSEDTGENRSTGLLRLAGRGTALLREVHRMPHALQGRLAYALSRGIGARIMVSSKIPLDTWLLDGRLDPELFRVLSGASIQVPALAPRQGDSILIANEALLDYALNRRQAPKELSPEATDLILEHSWPGNVRELLFVVTAAAASGSGSVIDREDLVIRRRKTVATSDFSTTIEIPLGGVSLKWIEEEAVRITLAMTEGNRSQAARLLGVSRPTLLKKLRSLEARQKAWEELQTRPALV